MYREIRQLDDKKVFHPRAVEGLTRKQLKKVIRSSLFLKEKYNPAGLFEKLKARLVAGGHMQDRSLYDDVSSPTVSTETVFLVAAIAAQEKRHVVTLDIGGAYLNASMKEHEVIMRLDAKLAMILTQIRPDYIPFLDKDGSMVVQLDKALYGCVESAKLWYEHLRKTLESLGFVVNPKHLLNQSVRASALEWRYQLQHPKGLQQSKRTKQRTRSEKCRRHRGPEI